MFLFVIITSCTALKLSDPASLRDVTEENVSLRAWCAGVGCVMPFTPASCLSWCDWNFDKQADAEARGAFAGTHWGEKKRKQATAFGIVLGSTFTTNDCNAKVTLHFVDSALDHSSGNKYVPIFPGGDTEKLSGDTYLKCEECYAIQAAASPDAVTISQQYHVKITKDATPTFGGVPNGVSRVLIYTYEKTNKCSQTSDILYSFDVAALTTANKGAKATDKTKWEEGTGGACIKYSVKDMVLARAQIALCTKCKTDTTCSDGERDTCYAKVNEENGVKDGGKVKGMTSAATARDIGFGTLGGLLWPSCKE